MPDVALLAQAVTDAPESYQVPGAQEIIVKSVRAAYDGSGAAGDFIPCLRVLDPNGNPVAECPITTKVTAGASADVSWFLGLGAAEASTGGGGITGAVEQFNQSAAATSIANSTTTILLPTNHLSGPLNFSASGGGMRCLNAGVYSINVNVQLASNPWTAGGGFEITLAYDQYSQVSNVWVTFPTVTADVHFPGSIQANVNGPPLAFSVGDHFYPIVLNLDGIAARSYQIQSCSMVQYS